MAPIALSPVKAGQDARLVAARKQAEAKAANERLVASGRWYEGVRGDYSRPVD
ncbi:hypothetical protein FHS85_002938 [Rhodoligotrophos appendicifer]|uniref:hypothetical protein n=1 Tax=Rhodoligotrophos appendicifer TaxID=987056 RepID=UPI00147870C1|nr:hypothetical protein [Rhodoligotrophos appendicifer]